MHKVDEEREYNPVRERSTCNVLSPRLLHTRGSRELNVRSRVSVFLGVLGEGQVCRVEMGFIDRGVFKLVLRNIG